ncbi:unnamed protein product [Leuciscus chuanchicus]
MADTRVSVDARGEIYLGCLEHDGVFIESLGQSVRGTVSVVVADNLAAHSFAGFVQSFRAGYVCRFCKATREEIQSSAVGDGEFTPRTKANHDHDLQDVLQGDGIVPVELALCIQEMIKLKYFTLEYLNKKILTFPYQHADKTDKPHPIPKNFAGKKSIGGNGHENITLLRLLPLMIGNMVPEENGFWNVLMDLKEVVEVMMAAPQKFMLRVYIATDIAVKVTLTGRPESVDDLIAILREKVKPRLDFEFTLQYEDTDFNGQLSCLIDIQELPEKATLKVVRSESDASSLASSDTEILPHVPVSERRKTWPDIFPLPTFSYEVQHVLEEGNIAYDRSGKTLKLSRAQKHNILESMASLIHSFKPYPSDKDVGMAAEALVKAHQCLKEPGSENGWYGWKISLKFKMGNYRTKLARSGCLEVSVNTGKRSKNNPDKDHPHSNIKRARRAEVNFLPNFPKGQNQASLEEMRLDILHEVEKSEKNLLLIDNLMQMTFSLRRQEIVQENPLLKDFLVKWPALRIESQVCAEFHRITNTNLRNQFYAELDRHTPQLFALYRQKASHTGKVSEVLRDLLRIYDREDVHDINIKRTVALRALAVYLCEDDPQFFKTWNVEESDEPDITGTPLALVMEVTENTGPVCFNPARTAVVVEDEFVLSDIPTFPEAFVLLFGQAIAVDDSRLVGVSVHVERTPGDPERAAVLVCFRVEAYPKSMLEGNPVKIRETRDSTSAKAFGVFVIAMRKSAISKVTLARTTTITTSIKAYGEESYPT